MKKSILLSLVFVGILAGNASAMESAVFNTTANATLNATLSEAVQHAPGLFGTCLGYAFTAIPYISTACEFHTAWRQGRIITSPNGLAYFSYTTLTPTVDTKLLLVTPDTTRPITEWTFYEVNQETKERSPFAPTVVDETHVLTPLMRPQTSEEHLESSAHVLTSFGATVGTLNLVQRIPMSGVSGFCVKTATFIAVLPLVKKYGWNALCLLGRMAKAATSCCHRERHAHVE